MVESELQIKSGKCRCETKKHHMCEKDYIWNPAICSCQNGKYLASIIDDSVIMRDKIINAEKNTVTTNFNEKNAICKIKVYYFLLAFFLMTILLLIAASIYCYLKQKHLLPHYITDDSQ